MYRMLLTTLFLTVNTAAFATRSYVEFGVSTELLEDLNFEISPEWRDDSEEDLTQLHTDLSLVYALTKRWNIATEYRTGTIDLGEESVDIDRKLLETKYSWKFKNFGIQTRIRYTIGENEEGEEKEYLRYRLKFNYDLDALNLKPFITFEKYDSLEADFEKNPNVYSAGLSWDITKSQQLSCEYRWVDKLHTRKDHVIVKLAYQFQF